MRLVYLAIGLVVVGIFLWLRTCADRKVEQVTGKEVVREDEEILGTWASRSGAGYVQFRLRRDGGLEYTQVDNQTKDSTTLKGTYSIAAATGHNASYFPRLYAFRDNGDTIFNYYIRYVTPYNTTVDKYDRLVMSPNSVYDTIEYTFYRIKQ